MPTYEQIKHLKPAQFRRACGVQPETFEQMVSVITQARAHQSPGRPSKLSIADQVLLTLEYLREYRTYFHIAQSWGVSEATVYRIVQRTETELIHSQLFRLPGRKQLLEPEHELVMVVVDVVEHPIERPQKKQRAYYSGKKKRHTLKSQVMVNQATGHIICTAHGKGRVHDFRLFKGSGVRVHPQRQCLADRGYQGLAKLHPNSCIPHKKRPNTPLSVQQRHENRQLAQLRVVIEHVNGYLKRFRILAERYRNRRRRFGLRFNLIAGIYNYELARSA